MTASIRLLPRDSCCRWARGTACGSGMASSSSAASGATPTGSHAGTSPCKRLCPPMLVGAPGNQLCLCPALPSLLGRGWVGVGVGEGAGPLPLALLAYLACPLLDAHLPLPGSPLVANKYNLKGIDHKHGQAIGNSKVEQGNVVGCLFGRPRRQDLALHVSGHHSVPDGVVQQAGRQAVLLIQTSPCGIQPSTATSSHIAGPPRLPPA